MTKLDSINTALLNIGDRAVTNSDDSQSSVLCKSILPEVLLQITNSHFWGFLYKTLDPLADLTYSGDRVLANAVQYTRVVGVSTDMPSQPPVLAAFAEEFVFDQLYAGQPMSGEDLPVNYYTISQDNSIRLSPYPTTNPSKSRLQVKVYRVIETPALDADEFDVPSYFLPIINLLLTAKLAARLLNNPATTQYFLSEYQLAHARLVQSYHTKPVGYRPSVI